MPESPPARRGGGGGGIMHLFCPSARNCILLSQYWGIHVYMSSYKLHQTKYFDKQKKNSFSEFYPNFARILPEFARILPEYRPNFARIRYIGNFFFFFFFFFFFGGGGGGTVPLPLPPPPPPPSHTPMSGHKLLSILADFFSSLQKCRRRIIYT